MSLAYDTSGTFKHPLYDGGELVSIPFSLTGSYTSKAGDIFVLTGAGTKAVDLGTVAKVRALLILVGTSSSADEVGVKINAQSAATPISPGGMLLVGSPSPSTGITSLSIDHATDITVQVIALG